MQRLIFIGLIVAMVLGVVVGALVYGDPGARAAAAQERIAAFDANRDGELSEAEFTASRSEDGRHHLRAAPTRTRMARSTQRRDREDAEQGADGYCELFQDPVRHFPASYQDDRGAAGADDADRGHRPSGRRGGGRADRRADDGLVHHRLAGVARARPCAGEPVQAGRGFPGHAGDGGGGCLDGLDGHILAGGVHHPRLPDLDRGRDGEERDPADRGDLAVPGHRAAGAGAEDRARSPS